MYNIMTHNIYQANRFVVHDDNDHEEIAEEAEHADDVVYDVHSCSARANSCLHPPWSGDDIFNRVFTT